MIGSMRLSDHSHTSHSGIAEFLEDNLGTSGELIDKVVIHSILDTLKLVLFLFLTYLLMEFIEHKATESTVRLMKKTGKLGPLVGGALGTVPQCGFSAAAASLYAGRVITLGTLVAVFLSTSDEMIPVLLAGDIGFDTLLGILAYKTAVGVAIGFTVDIAIRLMRRGSDDIVIGELCDGENCHCEKGIVKSAIYHTLTTGCFIFAATVVINLVVFIVGEDNISSFVVDIPVISHAIASVIGLVPNCAVSVVLSQLAVSGVISYGTMLSGLLTGAGVGTLVLFKMNKNKKENAMIILILIASGTLFGALSEFIF